MMIVSVMLFYNELITLYYLIVCTVEFSQPSYTVKEGSTSAQIEVVACNSLPENFDIMVTSRDGSATGEFLLSLC